MKKTEKTPGTTRTIKNATLIFPKKQACIDLLKNKVKPNEKVMVAVSGGADSILTASLMYNFFLEYKYNLQNLYFMHCNHNVRAGNADDQTFITNFFEGTQIIITKRTSSKKWNETELRNRRYGEFKKQIRKYAIDQMIFGHNLTDRIESTFLNLLRGANINGFLAMQIQEPHHLLWGTRVLRPILQLTKDEITQICKQNKIPFVTDPTNKDTTTSMRNKLRNKVLPKLYQLAHKQWATTNSFIESMKNIYEQVQQPQDKDIILEPIHDSPHRNAKFAYQRIIDPQKTTKEKVMQMMKIIGSANNITTPLLNEWTTFLQKNESGYKYFNKTYLFKSHGKIYLIAAPKAFWQKTIDTKKKITKVENVEQEGNVYEINKEQYLWATLRFPKKGDMFKNKTRNEWCINQKIPIFRRNFIPIIVKKNQIIHMFKNIM